MPEPGETFSWCVMVELFRELVRFLAALEPLQQELERLNERRQIAIATANAAMLEQNAYEEEELGDRLRQHLRRRSALISQARSKRLVVNTLQELLQALRPFVGQDDGIKADQFQQVSQWMERLNRSAWTLRRESWAAWHAMGRACRHVMDLRGLIASSGQQLGMEGLEHRSSTCGGVMLDARV